MKVGIKLCFRDKIRLFQEDSISRANDSSRRKEEEEEEVVVKLQVVVAAPLAEPGPTRRLFRSGTGVRRRRRGNAMLYSKICE